MLICARSAPRVWGSLGCFPPRFLQRRHLRAACVSEPAGQSCLHPACCCLPSCQPPGRPRALLLAGPPLSTAKKSLYDRRNHRVFQILYTIEKPQHLLGLIHVNSNQAMLTESLRQSDACICEVGEVEGVGGGAQRVWLEFHTILSPAQWHCLVL